MNDKSIVQLLKEECSFRPSDEIIGMFLASMEEIRLKPKERIIDYGRINTDVYCLKEGIIRMYHIEDSREITFGFATPGTVFLSPNSYIRRPAFMMVENCKKESVILRMSRNKFNELITTSHEFSLWMFNIAMAQLCGCERKLNLINGTAKDRYLAVIKNRPEIIEAVPGNVIASYLGVTPQYLCNLKKELAGE